MKCENCGAALPARPVDGVVRCQYCGTERRVAAPKPKPKLQPTPKQQPYRRPARAQPKRKFSVAGVIVMLLVIAAGGAMAIYQQRGKHRQAWTPADIDKAPVMKWVGISRRGMAGSVKAFDPVGSYPWALHYAQGWSPDAVLERIRVRHVRHDGVPPNTRAHNVEVQYTFFSPSRYDAAQKMAEVSDKPVPTVFTIWVHEGYTSAMIQTSGHKDLSTPQPEVSCPLAKVMAAAKQPPRPAKKRPYYDVSLDYVHQQWVWRVGDTYIDAKSCEQTALY